MPKKYDRAKQVAANKRHLAKIKEDPEKLQHHKEVRKVQGQRYYGNHKEEQNARSVKWREEHPEEWAEIVARSQEKSKKNKGISSSGGE